MAHDGEVTAAILASGAIDLIRARFRMTSPDGIRITGVSRSFPNATLRFLTGVPEGDRALEPGEVWAENPESVTDAIQEHADISEYDQLYVDGRQAIGQYEADEKRLYEFLWGPRFRQS